MALIPRADSATSYLGYWFYFFGFVFQLALGDEIPCLYPFRQRGSVGSAASPSRIPECSAAEGLL
jgi:hypothetical protein